MHRSYPVLAALALTACVTTTRGDSWSVRQVVENRHSLDGTTIIVRGWLADCRRLSCGLYDSREEERADRIHYYLSIAATPWFDREVEPYTPSYVVLAARLNDMCISDPAAETIAACADRPDTLVPIRIVRWGR
jgi:hypothetical protein